MKKGFTLFLLVLSVSAFAQKKVLDHTIYDSWQSIKEVTYQPHGKFVVYAITPQEGDAQ